jgi:hypothetical protein
MLDQRTYGRMFAPWDAAVVRGDRLIICGQYASMNNMPQGGAVTFVRTKGKWKQIDRFSAGELAGGGLWLAGPGKTDRKTTMPAIVVPISEYAGNMPICHAGPYWPVQLTYRWQNGKYRHTGTYTPPSMIRCLDELAGMDVGSASWNRMFTTRRLARRLAGLLKGLGQEYENPNAVDDHTLWLDNEGIFLQFKKSGERLIISDWYRGE